MGVKERSFAHDLRQPLGVIQLTSANLRKRLVHQLTPEDAGYLESKLTRIDQQIALMVDMLADQTH